MEAKLIFWPVIVLLLITQFLYIPLILRKIHAVKQKQVDLKKTALDLEAWSDEVKKVNNNLRNLFETPFIFYALCFIQFLTAQVTALSLGLAWLYVVLRGIHTLIHTRSNYVPLRMKVFASSMVVLLVMTIQTIINLL